MDTMEQHRRCFDDGDPAGRAFRSTRVPALSSWAPGQEACRCTAQPGCDPRQGLWRKVSRTGGPGHAPPPVPPDVCQEGGARGAELWARIFGFYSGMAQYASLGLPGCLIL